MLTSPKVPPQIADAIAAGALVVLNHSGGKDSQAMTALVRAIVPAEQLLVAHAILPEVEWPGTLEHAERTTAGLAFETAQAGKTLLAMAAARGKFPSPSQRQCTSDLKRGPIEKLIRRVCRERGILQVVQCLGLRAEESPRRARQPVVKLDKRLSKAGRTVLQWLPIFELTTAQVFETIAAAGQVPHWAYAAGMTRLSCCFCIMASRADLIRAAELNPELYATYRRLEQALDFTLSPSRRDLAEITGLDPTGLFARAIAAGDGDQTAGEIGKLEFRTGRQPASPEGELETPLMTVILVDPAFGGAPAGDPVPIAETPIEERRRL